MTPSKYYHFNVIVNINSASTANNSLNILNIIILHFLLLHIKALPKQSPEVFCKKIFVLKNLENFTRKHLC